MRRLLALLTLIMLIASACSNSSPGTSSSGNSDGNDDSDDVVDIDRDDDIAFASFLKPFTECSNLLDHLKAEASERVGPWGLNGGGHYFGDVAAMEDDESAVDLAVDDSGGAEAPAARADGDSAAEGGDAADGSYSSTNVQELGVDEPDIVKTDGKRIFVVKDNRLIIFDVTRAEPERVHNISLGEGWGSEMFITDTKVYVMGQGNGEMPLAADVERTSLPGGYYVSSTMITEVDLSDAEAEPLLRTLYIEGQNVSARLVGSDLRLVVSTFPNDLPFVAPGNSNKRAEDRAIEVNKDVIAESTLEDWLPSYSLVIDGETSSGLLAECDQVHAPTSFAGFGSLSVVSLDTSAPLDNGNVSSVLSEGQTVYASTEALYVTTNSWIDPRSWEDPEFRPSEDWSTSFHKFSTPVGAPAGYQASGKVAGMLLNQFSMSEHQGIFRVATTDGSPWDGNGSESFVTTFEQQGQDLVQLGQVGGLGKGEQIFSVRYVGDIAYVVTFRQTDPLYTIDLSNPAAPAVLGELKINGYSGYLHPVSDGLVVGIGQEATDEGQTIGAKVTLFDVSDRTNPVDLDSWVMKDSYSQAEWDHRSVLWWADEKMLVLPIEGWNSNFFGAVVLRIADGSITEIGRVDHVSDGPSGQTECRQLTIDDLPPGAENESELFWVLQDSGSFVQACSPDQAGGVTGYSCETFPTEQLSDYIGPVPTDLDLGDADRVEWCWQDNYGQSINRALVIDSNLWTLSANTLQANDLTTLERVARVNL